MEEKYSKDTAVFNSVLAPGREEARGRGQLCTAGLFHSDAVGDWSEQGSERCGVARGPGQVLLSECLKTLSIKSM